jgi:hypothetical protein
VQKREWEVRASLAEPDRIGERDSRDQIRRREEKTGIES